MRIPKFIVVLLSSLCVLFVSCKADKNTLTEAEKVLSHHFDAIRRSDVNAAMEDYSPEFFLQPKRDQETWKASLARIGEFRTWTIKHREVAHRANSHGDGIYVILHCQTAYATASYQEDFELFRRAGTTKFVIIRHDFD